jgi:hypothetical protein
MTVGDVVHDLSDRPAAGSVWRIELPRGQSGNHSGHVLGQNLDLPDPFFKLIVRNRAMMIILPDRIL